MVVSPIFPCVGATSTAKSVPLLDSSVDVEVAESEVMGQRCGTICSQEEILE